MPSPFDALILGVQYWLRPNAPSSIETHPKLIQPLMNQLALLLCGDGAEGTASIALSQLSSSVERFSTRAVKFLLEDATEETATFGPFCARVILENGCAALVGRLDSFRMLYLSEFQAQPEYEVGKRAKSAFAWAGDVIPEEKQGQVMWSVDHELPKISRALFSKHFDHVFWKPALARLLDYVSSYGNDPLLSDIQNIDPERFIDEAKGRSMQLYSTLSKGVHWEFFTSAILFDDVTVKNSIREVILLMAHLGLASHFVHTAYASLDHGAAIESYKAMRKVVL